MGGTLRRGSSVSGLFRDLRFIVVDELHAFIGSERGCQLQSLLHRIESVVGRRVPRVALSATLGDLGLAAEFLRPGGGSDVHQIISKMGRKEVKIQLRGYCVEIPDAEGVKNAEASSASGAAAIQEHLYRTLRGGRHIVFTNRRADVELYSDGLRRASEERGVPNEFWPHHGSLSKAIREDAESALKDRSRPATVLATSTLELGIDVGSVESIAQIGSPHSVASLRQRLGRSGRRDDPAVLRIYVSEPAIDVRTAPQDRIRSELIQSIAVVHLLTRRWCEAPQSGALHLSTLVQQLLSVIAERGGICADDAYQLLCTGGPFRSVTAKVLATFLRNLAEHDLIQQLHTGELVLGLKGERLISHYEFYSAFATPDEYRLVAKGRTLGTLPIAYPLVEKNYLIFAGRRWRVLRVDSEHKVAELEPAPGGRAPVFGGSGALIDTEIRREMRRVYMDSAVPQFLDQGAAGLLEEARQEFRSLGLHSADLIAIASEVLLFPWLGDRFLGTLALLLIAEGLAVTVEPPALRIERSTLRELEAILASWKDVTRRNPVRLAENVRNKVMEKHHPYLSEDLLARDYASSRLDLHEVEAWLTGRKGGGARAV